MILVGGGGGGGGGLGYFKKKSLSGFAVKRNMALKGVRKITWPKNNQTNILAHYKGKPPLYLILVKTTLNIYTLILYMLVTCFFYSFLFVVYNIPTS